MGGSPLLLLPPPPTPYPLLLAPDLARLASGEQPDPSMGYAYCLSVMLLRTYLWDPARSHPVARHSASAAAGLALLWAAAAGLSKVRARFGV